jgi:hypothetical protein
MNKSPSFQLYPDKLLAGTMHLSGNAFRAYIRILCWMWLHSKNQYSMPDTSEAWTLATFITDPAQIGQIKSEIMNPAFSLLKKNGKILWSCGLKKELEKQKKNRKKRQDAANKRWNNNLEPCKDDANASKQQCLTIPITTTTPTPLSSKKKKEPRTPKGGQIWLKINDQKISYPYRQKVISYLKGDAHQAALVFYRCYKENPEDPKGWINKGLTGQEKYALKACQDEYDNKRAVSDWIRDNWNKSSNEPKTFGSILKNIIGR